MSPSDLHLLLGATVLCLGVACSSTEDRHGPDLGAGGGADFGSGGSGAGGASSGGSAPAGGDVSGTGAAGPAVGGAAAGGSGTGGRRAGGGGAGGAGIGGTQAGGAGGVGTGRNGSGGASHESPLSLGMNDVTILVPLPETVAEPVLLLGSDDAEDGSPLVPQALVDRLQEGDSTSPLLNPETYERLHLVAVRFDLCDHNEPGPCPASGDARLRLVFQPIRESFGAEDVGFHAFYTIAEAEIPAALQALVELHELRNGPAEPLTVSATLTAGNTDYAEKLRAFVRAYAGEKRLVRLTMNAQPLILASVTWFFRGLEWNGTEFEDMLIEGTTETTQQVMLQSESFFEVTPVSDAPQGLALALDYIDFKAASESEKTAALEALVTIDNPLISAPDRVACVGCHTSTVSLATRSATMGLDPMTLPGRYETPFDVSIEGGESAALDRTLRALGFLGTQPLISQRVANDTALVLEDLARRAK